MPRQRMQKRKMVMILRARVRMSIYIISSYVIALGVLGILALSSYVDYKRMITKVE